MRTIATRSEKRDAITKYRSALETKKELERKWNNITGEGPNIRTVGGRLRGESIRKHTALKQIKEAYDENTALINELESAIPAKDMTQVRADHEFASHVVKSTFIGAIVGGLMLMAIVSLLFPTLLPPTLLLSASMPVRALYLLSALVSGIVSFLILKAYKNYADARRKDAERRTKQT